MHETQYIARVLSLVGDTTLNNVLRCAPMSSTLLHDAQANMMSRQALPFGSKQHDRTSVIISMNLVIHKTNCSKFSFTFAMRLA